MITYEGGAKPVLLWQIDKYFEHYDAGQTVPARSDILLRHIYLFYFDAALNNSRIFDSHETEQLFVCAPFGDCDVVKKKKKNSRRFA